MILQGNSYRIPLRDESVHAVVTSPPYWNLRDYQTGKWIGGNGECDHLQKSGQRQDVGRVNINGFHGSSKESILKEKPYQDTCLKCGATRIDNQIGLEPTIAAYVAAMVQVFREVWRVLRPDGVCFVNLGDSYSGGKNGRSAAATKAAGNDDRTFRDKPFSVTELPAKNLCMIPARVAIALQEDGWVLRSEMPWLKSNAMPSSVQDRPGTAHEHVFMLVKSARYYFDMQAVRKPNATVGDRREGNGRHTYNGKWDGSGPEQQAFVTINPAGRALRTSDAFFDSLDAAIAHLQEVRDNGGMLLSEDGTPAALVVNSESYKFSHYATFPRKLVAPLIKTTPEKVCPKCGGPWVRVVEKQKPPAEIRPRTKKPGDSLVNRGYNLDGVRHGSGQKVQDWLNEHPPKTTGWRPTCDCIKNRAPNFGMTGGDLLELAAEVAAELAPIGGIILDPFAGSGTVGAVAREHGRRFIGIDLSAVYLQENALPRSERLTSSKSLSQLPMFKPA